MGEGDYRRERRRYQEIDRAIHGHIFDISGHDNGLMWHISIFLNT